MRRRTARALVPSDGAVAGSYLILAVGCVVSIVPFLYVLSTSVKNTRSLFSYPPDWIPSPLFWGNYESLLVDHPFMIWTLNTPYAALFTIPLCMLSLVLLMRGLAHPRAATFVASFWAPPASTSDSGRVGSSWMPSAV